MPRGPLPACSCCHHRVDGLQRPSGRNASRNTPSTIMCRRPGATRIVDQDKAGRPRAPFTPSTRTRATRTSGLTLTTSTDKEQRASRSASRAGAARIRPLQQWRSASRRCRSCHCDSVGARTPSDPEFAHVDVVRMHRMQRVRPSGASSAGRSERLGVEFPGRSPRTGFCRTRIAMAGRLTRPSVSQDSSGYFFANRSDWMIGVTSRRYASRLVPSGPTSMATLPRL